MRAAVTLQGSGSSTETASPFSTEAGNGGAGGGAGEMADETRLLHNVAGSEQKGQSRGGEFELTAAGCKQRRASGEAVATGGEVGANLTGNGRSAGLGDGRGFVSDAAQDDGASTARSVYVSAPSTPRCVCVCGCICACMDACVLF